MNTTKQIFSLFLLIILIVGGFWAFENYHKSQPSSPSGLTLYGNGTATLAGIVSTNETGCKNNTQTQCFISVISGGNTMKVQYDTNENYFCKNEEAALTGRSAEPGMHVRASGTYRKTDNSYTLNTCGSSDYFIILSP